MSLASTIPHEMLSSKSSAHRRLPAETAVGPVALLQPSCGNEKQQWDSMHVSPAGCRRDEPIIKKPKCRDCELLH